MRGTSIWMSAVSLALVVSLPAAAMADKCTSVVAVTVPCSGLLLPSTAARDGLKCLETCASEWEARMALLRAELTAESGTARALLAAERERTASLSKLLDTALVKAPVREPALWEGTGFWGVVGFGLGVAATAAVVYAVK